MHTSILLAIKGNPEIYSNNRTNFTGPLIKKKVKKIFTRAKQEPNELLERLDQSKVYNRLRTDDVQWSFDPLEASHQGGVWKCMIHSVHKILDALLKEELVKNETVMSTFLCEVEGILNEWAFASYQ